MDNIVRLKIKMRVTTTERFNFQLDNILRLKTEMQVTITDGFSINSVQIKGEKELHHRTYIHGYTWCIFKAGYIYMGLALAMILLLLLPFGFSPPTTRLLPYRKSPVDRLSRSISRQPGSCWLCFHLHKSNIVLASYIMIGSSPSTVSRLLMCMCATCLSTWPRRVGPLCFETRGGAPLKAGRDDCLSYLQQRELFFLYRFSSIHTVTFEFICEKKD